MRVAVYGMNMSKVAGDWRGDHDGLVFRVNMAACDADASGGSCNGNGNGHGVLETADDDKGQAFVLDDEKRW